jgi:hypothetical protein
MRGMRVLWDIWRGRERVCGSWRWMEDEEVWVARVTFAVVKARRRQRGVGGCCTHAPVGRMDVGVTCL